MSSPVATPGESTKGTGGLALRFRCHHQPTRLRGRRRGPARRACPAAGGRRRGGRRSRSPARAVAVAWPSSPRRSWRHGVDQPCRRPPVVGQRLAAPRRVLDEAGGEAVVPARISSPAFASSSRRAAPRSPAWRVVALPQVEHGVGGEAQAGDAGDEAGHVGQRDRLGAALGQVAAEGVVEPRGEAAAAASAAASVGGAAGVAAARGQQRPERRTRRPRAR